MNPSNVHPSTAVSETLPSPEVQQVVSGEANQEAWNNAQTQVSTVEELREKAPEVYKRIVDSIFMQIMSHHRHAHRRLEQIYRKGLHR